MSEKKRGTNQVIQIRQDIEVSGQQINSAIGAVEINADSIVELIGVQANFAVGSVFIWSQIDTDQDPNYNQVDDSQSPGYVTIDDTQDPTWTEIEAGRDAA